MRYLLVCLCLFLFVTVTCAHSFTVTHRSAASKLDVRVHYQIALLNMALEKTKPEYGDYQLVPATRMNLTRLQKSDYIATFENYVFEADVTEKNEKNLLSVPVPISKGIFGYRIFLIHQKNQSLFDTIDSLDGLKKITIGQEGAWHDVTILRDGGFEVITGSNYEGLFKMLLAGRFVAFSRGVNEAFVEQQARSEKMPELAVEQTICLYYPLPRYFYTSRNNTLLVKRLTRGLEMMIDDGSFDALWHQYHRHYIEQAKLTERKIFAIGNKYVPESVPLQEPKYWYSPEVGHRNTD